MKKFAVILLATFSLAVSFDKDLIYLAFKARQTYIAKNMCINRNKPASKCKGKCHLSKSLEKSAANGSECPNYHKEDTQHAQFVEQLPDGLPRVAPAACSRAFPFQSNFRSQNFVADIFHPPWLVGFAYC